MTNDAPGRSVKFDAALRSTKFDAARIKKKECICPNENIYTITFSNGSGYVFPQRWLCSRLNDIPTIVRKTGDCFWYGYFVPQPGTNAVGVSLSYSYYLKTWNMSVSFSDGGSVYYDRSIIDIQCGDPRSISVVNWETGGGSNTMVIS